MKITVISHFRNEEALLPFWLRHHRNLFDHGIMIDYYSTDRSVEIIRELVPSWEIRNTVNRKFATLDIDGEVTEVEKTVKEWKMVLNVPEFVFHDNLHTYITEYQKSNPGEEGIITKGIIMQDTEALLHTPLPPDTIPLWDQRHFGFSEEIKPQPHERKRLLHKAHYGRYDPGRHTNGICKTHYAPFLYLLWYGWCPLRLKIERNKSTIPMLYAPDQVAGWSTHHTLNEAAILEKWRTDFLPYTHDIFDGTIGLRRPL